MRWSDQGYFAKNREAAGQDTPFASQDSIFWRAPFPNLASRKNRESRFSRFLRVAKIASRFLRVAKIGKIEIPDFCERSRSGKPVQIFASRNYREFRFLRPLF